MPYGTPHPHSYSLQATLSASSAGGDPIHPHHPITCQGKLYYEEDGALACEHAMVPAENLRTQQCVTHSIAILLLEIAQDTL